MPHPRGVAYFTDQEATLTTATRSAAADRRESKKPFMDVEKFTAAAWLPAPDTIEAHQHGCAVVERWIRDQEEVVGAPSVLLTCDFQVDDHGLLGTYRRGSTHYSAKAGGPPSPGPVFACNPTRKALRATQQMAQGAICCVGTLLRPGTRLGRAGERRQPGYWTTHPTHPDSG